MRWLSRLGSAARPAVYVLAGDGARPRARNLALDPRLERVASPRHADILLVVGALPEDVRAEAAAVHDQVPPPRGVVEWGGDGAALGPWADAVPVAAEDDPVPVVMWLQRALFRGERPSSEPIGPAENPVPWKGLGPHGQGGEGMMGGTPYGRPMAMTAEDVRDGLQLDCVTVPLGPFLPWMPPGLRVDVDLQGDVVQALRPVVSETVKPDVPEPFVRALHDEVPVAEIEVARARHHLHATADLLWLHHLDALAVRALRVACALTSGGAEPVRRLERALRRTGALRLATRGVGRLSEDETAGLGPTARAAGRAEDARLGDPAYEGLGFEVRTGRRGDTQARWQQRLVEAAQALELAARAGDRRREPGPPLEGPRGTCPPGATTRSLELLRERAVGRTFDRLVTTLVGLDLDPGSVPHPRRPAEEGPHA
ncbi:MAG: hypothetical protein ACODAG_10510 [Myxococcota bacterium]